MPADLKIIFEILFSEEQLIAEFKRRHRDSVSRGLDRRNGPSFEGVAEVELGLASKKCLLGNYVFTPYLENLKVKDYKSLPRRISVPVVKDRVVLSQLNKFLRIAFPEESESPLASSYVRKLAKDLDGVSVVETWTAGCDIKKFYDSIDRGRLRKLLEKKLKGHSSLETIMLAINTVTVSETYRKKNSASFVEKKGVPQGLAISNVLAAIYLSDVDLAMRKMPISYYRFVDDVLLVGEEGATRQAQRSFAARVRARGLSVHKLGDKKSHHQHITVPFQYLGYYFEMPKITVREATIERLIQSLASKISDYKYNHKRVVERRVYLTDQMYKNIFIDELNERISGAISKDKKYGWVAYFSEINDESVLHRLDSIVKSLLGRVPELSEFSGKTKRFSRAYFEMKHRPYGGYVRNYDVIVTPAQMVKFLSFRGRVGPGEKLSEDQVRSRFEAYRDRQLGLMLADEVQTY